MFQFVHQLVIILPQVQFLHSLHQSLQISHPKQLLDERLGSELLEVIDVLSSS